MSKGLVMTVGWGLMTAVSLCAQTVTGSGTSGTVPVFTGASSIGNSPIAVSGSNVGIGTTTPNSPLTIANAWDNKIDTQQAGQSFDLIGTYYGWNPTAVYLAGYNSTNSSTVQTTKVIVGGAGSTLPLEITGTLSVDGAANSSFSGNVGIGTTSPNAKLEVNGNLKFTSGSGASITFADGSQQTTAWTGTLCGGDYAESVNAAGKHTLYAPGDVLVLTGDGKGDVEKSSKPYSTMVAGIYATKPGVVGRRIFLPKTADDLPMAMVGIVPTKVSAENGPIRRGDLLVSSSAPGYAMKGTDRTRMLGAVVGKAMGSLESGKGMIEVLVTLQ